MILTITLIILFAVLGLFELADRSRNGRGTTNAPPPGKEKRR